MKLQRWCKVPLVVGVFLIATQVVETQRPVGSASPVARTASPALSRGFTPASVAQEQIEAQTGATVITPQRLVLPSSPTPFELTPEQYAYYNARIANVGPARLPMGPQSPNIAGPEPGTQSEFTVPSAGGPDPAAPGSFIVLQNQAVPGGTHGPVNEPSVAQEGGYVFYTGNWHAARSRCGGNDYGFPEFCDGGSFVFINPYADMGDFCCDQDTIADNRRQIIIWYRQGLYNHASGPPNQNRIRIGVGYDAFGAFGGCFYDVRPIDLNPAFTNQWFDYPHLALSNDFLWFSTAMFSGGGAFLRQVWVKVPLDGLAACAPFSQTFAVAPDSWGHPVQGATTQMYFGSHQGTNNSFRISWWNEDSMSVFSVVRTIPTFTFQNGNSNCTARPGGTPDWTQRGDSRIQAGWVRHLHVTAGSGGTIPVPNNEAVGEVGFMWNANQGGGFPQPYAEAATFRQDTLAVVGRPNLWTTTQCFQYPHASPNHGGDLGIVFDFSSAGQHISTGAALDDDFNGVPPPWQLQTLLSGNSANPTNQWGDYNRIRPNYPSGRMWVSGGHTVQGGVIESRYFVFGRERDQNSYWKFIWSRW